MGDITFNHQLTQSNITYSEYCKLKDTLPSKEVYEFMYYAYLTGPSRPDHPADQLALLKKNHQLRDQWDYPPHDVIRFNKIVTDNADVIYNKRCVDFPAHLGYVGYMLEHAGAASVHCYDVHEYKKNIAMAALPASSNIQYDMCNIHDYDAVTAACNLCDTALFLGIMYHITDQPAVLDAISRSSCTNLIIDSVAPPNSRVPNNIPFATVILEDPTDDINGFVPSSVTACPVIYPNKEFLSMLLQQHGWKEHRYSEYTMKSGKQTRFVVTYTR